MQAPVASGLKGRETPAGIFSVLQKEAEHYSNMYDDAHMPHMQRLTWSGIALHGTGIFYGGIASTRTFPELIERLLCRSVLFCVGSWFVHRGNR